MSVELRHLRSFLAVVDAGGIAPGARRSGQAQSAVSNHVRRLEEALEVQLLLREHAGIVLTDAGRTLALQVRPAVAALESAVERARRRAATPAGTITVSAFSYMQEPLGLLLAELRRTDPAILVTLRVADFITQLRDLQDGLVDAALLTFAPDDPGLELHRLSSHPIAVVVSDRHRLAGRTTLRFADIADELWPRSHPDVPAAWVDQICMMTRRGRRPPFTPEVVRNPDEVWALIATGKCICTVPAYLLSLVDAIAGLRAIRLEDGDPLELFLARRAERPTRPALAALFAAAARRAG